MNYGSIRYIIGWILRVEALLMLLPIGTAVVYQESSGWAFVISAALCLILGIMLSIKKPKKTTYYTKEGYISVALGWIVMSIMGCLPFVISGEIPSFVNALFETVSGFTTTGASILHDVDCSGEALPIGSAEWEYWCLFWRSCLWPAVSIIFS